MSNRSSCDIPGSEGYGAESLIPPSIRTTTNTSPFRGQGQSAMKTAGMDPSDTQVIVLGSVPAQQQPKGLATQPSGFLAGGQVTATKGTYECHEMS